MSKILEIQAQLKGGKRGVSVPVDKIAEVIAALRRDGLAGSGDMSPALAGLSVGDRVTVTVTEAEVCASKASAAAGHYNSLYVKVKGSGQCNGKTFAVGFLGKDNLTVNATVYLEVTKTADGRLGYTVTDNTANLVATPPPAGAVPVSTEPTF